MMQFSHGMDGTKRKKPSHVFKKRTQLCRQSVGDDLDVVEADKVTPTNAEENKHRRTIILNRTDGQSWGFTVQSYGIHHIKEDEVELLTYIDYVAHNSPAFLSGMRSGDVILSINGANMEEADHLTLINFIRRCDNSMRMVVLFEDCCRKVELHHRYLKLKRVLAEKIFEVRSLEQQEMRIMSGLSRFDSCRSSRVSRSSSASSNSVFDDRRSLLPELDRCPTPRSNNHLRAGLSSSFYNPDMYSSLRSLSPLPMSSPLDFDHSSLPMRKHHSHSLVASVSLHAALSASVKNNGYEASGGSSPMLNRHSPTPTFDTSPIFEHSDGEASPRQQYRSKRTKKLRSSSSSLDYRLPPPNRDPQRSARHVSTPDKLNPSMGDLSEALELSLFRLHTSGVDTRESATEMPDDCIDSNHVVELPTGTDLSPPPLCTNTQPSEYGDLLDTIGVKTVNQQHAPSLNSSGSSVPCHMDSSVESSFRCSSPVSDPGTPYSVGASSTDSNFSYSDLPVIELDLINDEDAVSHL